MTKSFEERKSELLLERLVTEIDRAPQQQDKPARGWLAGLNWDVIGITTVGFTLASAAILYTFGWIYEANWYGYYGIEISILDLPPYQVMIEGFYEILYVFIITSLFVGLFSLASRSSLRGLSVFQASMLAVSLLFLAFITIQLRFGDITFSVGSLSWASFWYYALTLSYIFLYYSTRNKTKPALIHPKNIIILLFIISISSFYEIQSATDAQNGRRLSLATWHLQQTYVYSPDAIPSLSDYPANAPADSHAYGPFALLINTKGKYYLTTWQEDRPKDEKPRLFIIPEDGVELKLEQGQ